MELGLELISHIFIFEDLILHIEYSLYQGFTLIDIKVSHFLKLWTKSGQVRDES